MFVRNFIQFSQNDVAIAGGKGASLGEMASTGIPVPPGFVVFASAFRQFLAETDLNVEVEVILEKVDPQKMHTVEDASKKIQALILAAEFPQDLKAEIEKEFKKLGSQFVAVRSSATAEDSSSAAWAGQLNTYLNTIKKTLIENVQKCWASLFTPRAIFYRFEKDLHKTDISVAVVVQKMVESEKSGIAFSVHPVTEDPNQLIIEAGWGLGEAIVSGAITPNSYVVEKDRKNILDINVSEQKKGLFQKSGGGNEWKKLGEKGKQQVLSQKEILELSELIMKIENHYGFPCDIEWAEERGRFYITQSRPITTLNKKNSKNRKQEFRKYVHKSKLLLECQAWDLGERVELPRICKNKIYFDPIFYFEKEKGVSVYYNYSDFNQDYDRIVDYFNRDKKEFYKLEDVFIKNCRNIGRLFKKKKASDLARIFEYSVKLWPFTSLIYFLGDDSNEYASQIDPELVSESQAIRKKSEKVLYLAGDFFAEMIEKIVPLEYKKWTDFLSLEEIETGKFPSSLVLKKRASRYILYKGKIFSGEELKEFARRNNIEIKNFKTKSKKDRIRGVAAFAGVAQGTVINILNHKEGKKVKRGDVLVTPMTTPNMTSVIKRVAAIVTDEGSITSHAAIISRELKKPCIIGTGIATQILEDGDLVEVDANEGIVRILNREERA